MLTKNGLEAPTDIIQFHAVHACDERGVYTASSRRKIVAVEKGSLIKSQGQCAWVNAANCDLEEGAGVCGAIFKEARTKGNVQGLKEACKRLAPQETGWCVSTPGFGLPIKHIIHAVGPIWSERGSPASELLLRRTYARTMLEASKLGVKNLAFAGISNGIYGGPEDKVAAIAIEKVLFHLSTVEDGIERVTFRAFTDSWFDSLVKHLGAETAVIDW